METVSVLLLQELSDKVQAAQRQVDAARAAVEDDKRKRSGSVVARIADFFIRTRPEHSLDDCEAKLASLTYQGKNAARAWIIATAGQRLAEHSADAILHRDQTQRLDHALNRAEQVNGWLALTEAAHGHLWAAHRACNSASTSELLDAMTSSKGIAALSYLDTSSAANAVTRARLAVEALVRALPKQVEPAEIQQPGDSLDLAVDLVFDPGFDVLSCFNMFRLDDSANKCALVAGTLQPLLNRLRNMSSDVAAKAEQERKALRSIQTPYLEAAAGDVPDLLRVEIPADCVLRAPEMNVSCETKFDPSRLSADDLGQLWHPDMPDRDQDVSGALSQMGFDVCLVFGDTDHFTRAALDDGGIEYWDQMQTWEPSPAPQVAADGWLLAAKIDSEDGPLAIFVIPRREYGQQEVPQPQKPAYEAVMILGEDDWEIRCPIGRYSSEEAAQSVLYRTTAEFKEVGGIAYIATYTSDIGGRYRTLQLFDADLTIRQFTAAAAGRRGPPLDMRVPGNRAAASDALTSFDPAYIFGDDDFEPSPLKLADFLLRYGSGYRPDFIATDIRVDNAVQH